MLATVAPCEYPKITIGWPVPCAVVYAPVSATTPLCTESFHLAPCKPPQPGSGMGQN